MWEKTYKVLQEYAIELRNSLQDSYINDDRIASGELLNSVEYRIEKEETTISVFLDLASWWKFIEWDTKPHFPPPEAMLKYVRVKPVIPREGRNGKLPTEQQLAYLIGRKISEVGTKGTNNLENTVKNINSKYNELIESAITEDVSNELTVIFSEYFAK